MGLDTKINESLFLLRLMEVALHEPARLVLRHSGQEHLARVTMDEGTVEISTTFARGLSEGVELLLDGQAIRWFSASAPVGGIFRLSIRLVLPEVPVSR